MTSLRDRLPQGAASRWAVAWLTALLLCFGALTISIVTSSLQPASTSGVAYGVAAAALLLLACAYPVRRRSPRRGPLAAHTWLRLHFFGGVFFLVLVLMHSGFRRPAGPFGWALWTLSLWTPFSGAVGLVVQWWIPQALSSGLTTEVHYERIPALVAAIAERAEALVAGCGDSVKQYYRDTLAAPMGRPQARLIYFADVTGGLQARIRDFDYLSRFADAQEQQRIAELRDLWSAKLSVDAHYTLQRALRWWVYGHVPFVGLLIVFVAVHVVSVLYY